MFSGYKGLKRVFRPRMVKVRMNNEGILFIFLSMCLLFIQFKYRQVK